jgi:hypothetical protein
MLWMLSSTAAAAAVVSAGAPMQVLGVMDRMIGKLGKQASSDKAEDL